MELNEQEIQQIIKLQKANKIEQVLLVTSFGFLIGTLLSTMFFNAYTVLFLIGALIPLGNVLLMKNNHALMPLVRNIINSNANNIKTYAQLKR